MAFIFYDTNALLNLREKAFEQKFACSHKTLEEIESIKTSGKKDDETRYRARKLARAFQDYNNYIVCNYNYSVILKVIEQFGLEVTPDAVITAEAYLFNTENSGGVIFVTDDVNCYNIAKRIFNLKTESVNNVTGEFYKGYIRISGTEEQINTDMEKLQDSGYSSLYPNEYIIIHNTSTQKSTEMRFNGEALVPLRLPPSNFIKGKNSLQRCALDALLNKDIDIVAVLGTYGSGKMFA